MKRDRNNRFARWFYGEEDTLLNKVEMKPQKPYQPPEGELRELLEEHEQLREHIYDVEDNRKLKLFDAMYRVAAVIFCVTLISIMLVTVSWLPENGNADNPVNNEVSARYIEKGLQETGAVNIVTGMILDYRAFDTFGESNVLFIATITVLILLRLDTPDAEEGNEGRGRARKKKKTPSAPSYIRPLDDLTIAQAQANDRIYEPKNDVILQKAAGFLVPVIIIFGIYVILNGHLSPGGGFSGGAIIGAGLILYLNAFGFAKTERFFTEKTYKWTCFFSLTFYCLAKSYSFFTGANHLESGIPLGTPGAILSSGLILPLNICVGLVVACTMYAFYALFRKGGF